jgi:glycosyltransferase involved in cell wall biosynthesis
MMISSNNSFSVLMAVYHKDDPDFLRIALESVYANTLKPDAVVLVKDGPVGESISNVINEFVINKNFSLIELEVNRGLANALNAGLSTIHTKYTIRADADDFNHPDRFEQLIEKLQKGYDLVGSSIKEVDKFGQFLAIRRCPASEQEIRQFIRKRNPFNHMSVAFRTEVVISAGGYPSIHLKEDYALWASLVSRNYKVCNIETVLVDATAGTEMFQRRGGVRYALAEIDLQRHLIKCGLKSHFSAVIDGVMRSAIFLAPNAIREFVYLRFLREQKDKQ